MKKYFVYNYEKNMFYIINKVYSDRSEIDISDTTIRIQNFRFSRKLLWKTDEITTFGKAHTFQTIKDIESKFS